MAIRLIDNEHRARIKVVGVGGSGGNAINRMIESGMHGVEFVAVNTDAQALETSRADFPICIGSSVTRGLGAGADPEVGRQAIEEDRDKVSKQLQDSDLIFITAGMGGGTGTGAAPTVAEISHDQGALTVGIVTEPFVMEGSPRMKNARSGIAELKDQVDTLITIKNQRLLEVCGRDTTLQDAFLKADEVLMQATRGISDLITIPGMVNLDFNDVRTVISKGGDAIMGLGEHSGEERAVEAARKAINSPLLEDVSITGAKGVLINIAGDSNLTLYEINEVMSLINEETGSDAEIIFGTVIDDSLTENIRVTVIATGFNVHKSNEAEPLAHAQEEPTQQDVEADPLTIGSPVLLGNGNGGTSLEVPTYLRNGHSIPQEHQEPVRPAVGDLDIPTFLRRKMNAS
ncbi:MAG: cell division protein FtsZ [Gemmatimonadetes bacterium]|nr:cell division protein FtsZ [Gemmatimonadota bacterium]MXY83416.1 cell division protein FtsZ [Gemmatimonadota bacterium]MYB67766.1 cell division protein FtsZ [Gemmatimonadota bacterium]